MGQRGEAIRCPLSAGGGTQWFHAEQETTGERFPMEVIHNDSMPDRKLFAKSFLLSMRTVVSHRDRILFAKGVPIERKDNAVHRDGPPSFSLSLVILY